MGDGKVTAYDYDRRLAAVSIVKKGMFDIRLATGALPTHLLRVFVDDEQIGLLTSFQLKSSALHSLMEIRIGLLEGFSREAWEGCSPGLKESARKAAARLRSVPTVILSCPDYL